MLPAIRTFAAYNSLAFSRLWDSIVTLDDDQFTRDFDYSRGSVASQANHATGAQGRWLRGFQRRPGSRTFNPTPESHPTPELARALWESEDADFRAYVDDLNEEDLHGPGVEGMDQPLYVLLLHVLNHGTDHRAQILRLLHELGAETFEQDLVFFLGEMDG